MHNAICYWLDGLLYKLVYFSHDCLIKAVLVERLCFGTDLEHFQVLLRVLKCIKRWKALCLVVSLASILVGWLCYYSDLIAIYREFN